MRDLIGGYKPEDIQFVCAFDVDERKVDLPIAQAIWSKPNCCYRMIQSDPTPICPGKVHFAPILDGVAPHMHAHGTPLPNVKIDDAHRFVLSKKIPSEITFNWEA